jgi:hypothetical protein
MKHQQLFLIVALMLFAGCASKPVPVVMQFPDVPDDLKVACPVLDTLPDNTDKLSEVVDTVANNYSKYHECRARVDNWNQWYSTQKQIFDKVK